MGKVVKSADAFLNFATFSGTFDAADSSVLVEIPVNTGLSIRGALIWLMHLVEAHFEFVPAAVTARAALSTRQGLVAMPVLGDDGLVALFELTVLFAGAAYAAPIIQPLVQHFLPPIPLATPQLSLYTATGADVAGMRGDKVDLRIGFTTAPLDGAAYVEVAEAWGW